MISREHRDQGRPVAFGAAGRPSLVRGNAGGPGNRSGAPLVYLMGSPRRTGMAGRSGRLGADPERCEEAGETAGSLMGMFRGTLRRSP
ncbi:protein of unknown function [Streptomyces sp. KY75]|nr:protein of unknown function [Streptomyces sp. KY75]CAD5985437.1 protein of unknown function [Streptomyces sp. KY70]